MAGLASLALLLAGIRAFQRPASAQQEPFVVFGPGVEAADRAELFQTLGVPDSVPVIALSRTELRDAVRGSGLKIPQDDTGVFGIALTCLPEQPDTTVATRNVSRIPPLLYVSSLVAAGAPPMDAAIAGVSASTSGESAIVGLLFGAANCPGASLFDPAEAYLFAATTAGIAPAGGDLEQAAGVAAGGLQAIARGSALDAQSLAEAVDQAAQDEGMDLPAARRRALLDYLTTLIRPGIAGAHPGLTLASSGSTSAVATGVGRATPPSVTPSATATPPPRPSFTPTASPSPSGTPAPTESPPPRPTGFPSGTPPARPPSTTPIPPGGETPLPLGSYDGSVLGTQDQTLAVAVDGRFREFIVDPDAVITKDGVTVPLSSVLPGDDVTVTTTGDGLAHRVAARTPSSGPSPLWLLLIPAVLSPVGAAWAVLRLRARPSAG